MIKVAAGIVTFNPIIERLKENIASISPQVDIVFCFDNGSENICDIKKLTDSFSNVELINNKINCGIAEGLNIIFNSAREEQCEWVLTLDQDSVCPANMIEKMLGYAADSMIAAVCPVIIDQRRPKEKLPENETDYVNFCITSGCLVNANTSKKIGDFDSWLFIGQVDDEFCHRVRINGYKILRVNTIYLDHELGSLSPSRFKKLFLSLGRILKSNKIMALSYKRKVSPTRVYYSTRNIIYLSKKYKMYPNTKFTKKRAVKNAIANIIRGQKKIEITKAAINGYKAGIDKEVQMF